MKNYFPVNDLAPREEDGLTLFVKKVNGPKSDGFAVVDNGKVFVIDIGRGGDAQLIRFLADLRDQWLGETRLADGESAKLELTLIISHAHSDHMAALPLLLNDERFCVTDIYAPERSCLSTDLPEELPHLTWYESRLESICEELSKRGHTAKGITRIPFGRVCSINMGSADSVLKIYSSPFDWSQDRPCDKEGLCFIRANNPSCYKDKPQVGYANGILNGNSLWVKVIKGKHSVLITGDQRDCDEMLGTMIRYYGEDEFDCDVLKIPHHGESNYSPYLMSVAKPQFTVFTTSYEKATRDTVKLCEEMGCINYYTCDGDLFFFITEKEIKAFGIDPQ